MIKLEISKIVFSRLEIGDQERTIYEWARTNHRANIFCMRNGGGKTLLFTAINYILSGKDDNFLDKRTMDICIKLDVKIDNDEFVFKRGYNLFDIVCNGVEMSVSDYQDYIEQKLGIEEELIDKKGDQKSQRNTPLSLFRFGFYSDNDLKLKNKGSLQSINLIDSRFDGMGKKALFAYHLGVNLTAKEYKQIKSYLYKKKYIEDNQKLVDKNKKFYHNDGNLFFDPKESEKIYEKLSSLKRKLGDITLALEKIQKIIDEYVTSKGEDDDYHFLLSQKGILEQHRKNIVMDITSQKDKFKQYSMFEKQYLSENKIIEKDIQRIELYYSYQKEIAELEKGEIPSIIKDFVDPELVKFKTFLDAKRAEYGIKTKYPNINFDVDNLAIIIGDGLSEGEAIFLRIVSSLLLGIYGNQLEGSRCFNVTFYDSIVEKIDDDNVEKLFDIIEKISQNEKLLEIFVFSTNTLESRDSKLINFNYKNILS